MKYLKNLKGLRNLLVLTNGLAIFFLGILLPSLANLTGLYSFYSTTKYLTLLIAAILSIVTISLYIPKIKLPKHIAFKINGAFFTIFFIGSLLLSDSFGVSVLGAYGTWEFNILTYVSYILIAGALLVWFSILAESNLLYKVSSLLIKLFSVATIFYGLGEAYIWKPQTGYLSNYVSRISLGFKNPLLAGFLISLLLAYCFTELMFIWTREFKTGDNKNKFWKFLNSPITRFIAELPITFGLLYILFLTYSRSTWIGTAVTLLLITLYFVISKKIIGQAKVRILGTVFVLIAGVIIMGVVNKQSLIQRNEDIFSDSNGTISQIARSIGGNEQAASEFFKNSDKYSSTQIRLMEWVWALRTIVSDPKIFMFGTGPDASSTPLMKYRPVEFNTTPTDSLTRPNYIRNFYIQILLMHGIEVSSVTFTILIIIIIAIIKKIRKLNAESQFVILPFFALIISFLIQSIFYFPTFPILLLTLFCFVYIVFRLYSHRFMVQKTHLSVQIIILPFIVPLVIWFIVIFIAERKLDDLSFYFKPTRAVLQNVEQIPVNSLIFKRVIAYYYPDEQQSQVFLKELENSRDLDDLRTAAAAYYTLAKENKDSAQLQKSIDILNKMRDLDPTSPVHVDELGLRNLYKQNFDEASKLFDKAMELKPDYWFSYLHKGETLRQMCKPKEAISYYEKAKGVVPQADQEIIEAKIEIDTPRPECKK